MSNRQDKPPLKCLLGIDPEKSQKCKPSECALCGWEAAEAARRQEVLNMGYYQSNISWWYRTAGKELFNMKENKHGFEPKQEFTMGGIAWTVIQTGADWVKCIASDYVEERAFDEENKNDFAASSIRAYLNGDFFRRLIKAGAPEDMFKPFNIDLTADDGLKNYGCDRVRIGLITCEEYRLLRGNIPALPNKWWWMATPDSPTNNFVRYVYSDGTLLYNDAYYGSGGVRPLCNLKSEILVSYLERGRKEHKPETHKPETCRERMKRENPALVSADFVVGCLGCPHIYGYTKKKHPMCGPELPAVQPDICWECWDRPVEE